MTSGSLKFLFMGRRLSDVLAVAASRATEKLAAWPADDLLSTSEADVVALLMQMATVEIPSLIRDEAQLEPPIEVKMDSVDFGSRFPMTVTRFILVVPVTGDPAMFGRRASRFSAGSIQAEIDHTNGSLRLHCDNPANADAARTHFERTLDAIAARLEWTRTDIIEHNRQMARQIPHSVAQRRAKLLNDRDLHASVGYSITKRQDASDHTVPIKRRKIIPDRPAPLSARRNVYVPEPTINDDDYEAVLAVLRNGRNSLERSPSLSAKLDEEEARDVLLFYLNGQFEGRAAGEVFNCMGKTDILVREGDRNVFIGECKIFDPKNKKSVDSVVTSALSQLLNYLVWRDTKAALLLFIRSANVSDAVEKAVAAISGHPNCKRRGKISSEERHDFVLHANGDKNREIHLAFLPFLIAGKAA